MDLLATNSFRLPCKEVMFFLAFVILIGNGCQHSQSDTTSPVFGQHNDITEDLHHRLRAGLFEVGKDPVIAHIIKKPNVYSSLGLPFYSELAPYTMVRVSWERGSFWVKSDDHALVVIYMDMEATYSHVHLSTLDGFRSYRGFRQTIKHPIR